MKKNVGTVDLIIRLVIAAVIAILFFTKTISGIPGIVLIIFAIVLAVTGLIGFCPLYTVFGIKTNTAKTPGKKS